MEIEVVLNGGTRKTVRLSSELRDVDDEVGEGGESPICERQLSCPWAAMPPASPHLIQA